MLKSALILGAAVAAAGSAAPGDGRAAPGGVFVLFSGGAPTLQINIHARGTVCPFETPKAPAARRGKPVFAAY
ncbi:hypothetical protein [Sphingosinicella microcystinivorans]|uniref:hypothetical protein n=1 Tax=Sphingosinicella microcystinivorans TaxID=335406 RepID=UPI0022F3D907|nr:hypothetical protein [Sphingosinicella microcystinivorans]WBX83270.1 hypothetical protein PE061_15905 [Sphingosinicella microcystinivorans]